MKGITEDLEEFQQGIISSDFRINALCRLIPKTNGKALDIGAGSGIVSKYLSRHYNVHAIDYSNKLVEGLKKIPGIIAHKMDAAHLKFKDNHFDLVVMTDILEHMEMDVDVMQEARRVLKQDGLLFVSVPAMPVLYGKRDKNAGHYRRYSKKELNLKIRKAGFRKNNTRHWNMLGVLPYLISEKILKKELNPKFRQKKSPLNNIMAKWLKVENKIDFKIGLSLICVAKK